MFKAIVQLNAFVETMIETHSSVHTSMCWHQDHRLLLFLSMWYRQILQLPSTGHLLLLNQPRTTERTDLLGNSFFKRLKQVQRFTYPTSSGRHCDYRWPLIGSGIVSLCAAQFRGIISAAHRVDHILVYGTAQVFPTGTHGCHCMPAVLLRVIPLHCNKITVNKDSAFDL